MIFCKIKALLTGCFYFLFSLQINTVQAVHVGAAGIDDFFGLRIGWFVGEADFLE